MMKRGERRRGEKIRGKKRHCKKLPLKIKLNGKQV
jgi:hypothetical protein